MTDTIPIHCSCGKQFVVKAEHVGKRVRCKGCGTVLTISAPEPDPAEDIAPPPAASEAAEAAETAPAPPPEDQPAEAAAPAEPRPTRRPAPHISMRDAGGFEPVEPAALLAGLGSTHFPRTLAVALVVFAIFVGVTSIGFIGLCIKHSTMFPMAKVAAEAKAAQEEQDRLEREKTLKKLQPPTAAKPATAEPAAEKPAADTPSGDSKIEQELRETSNEKPKELNLDLGSPGGLE